MYNFSELEIYEHAEMTMKGAHVSVTRTIKARSSEEFDAALVKEVGEAARIILPSSDSMEPEKANKWAKVSEVVLPLIPVALDTISKIPILIEAAQKLGIIAFSTELAPTCKSRSISHEIRSGLEVHTPEEPSDNVFTDCYVTVTRSPESVEVNWNLSNLSAGPSQWVWVDMDRERIAIDYDGTHFAISTGWSKSMRRSSSLEPMPATGIGIQEVHFFPLPDSSL